MEDSSRVLGIIVIVFILALIFYFVWYFTAGPGHTTKVMRDIRATINRYRFRKYVHNKNTLYGRFMDSLRKK